MEWDVDELSEYLEHNREEHMGFEALLSTRVTQKLIAANDRLRREQLRSRISRAAAEHAGVDLGRVTGVTGRAAQDPTEDKFSHLLTGLLCHGTKVSEEQRRWLDTWAKKHNFKPDNATMARLLQPSGWTLREWEAGVRPRGDPRGTDGMTGSSGIGVGVGAHSTPATPVAKSRAPGIVP